MIVTVIATGFDATNALKAEAPKVESVKTEPTPVRTPVVGGGSTEDKKGKEIKPSNVPSWLQNR